VSNAVDPEEPALDANELELEKQKLALEERRVVIDERKARQGFWTRVTVLIPIVAALIALGGTALSRHQESRDEIKLQELEAQDAFELKAVELVMSAETAFETLTRAKAVKALFPQRLPDGFAATFDPERNTDFRFRIIASKKELLTLLAEHPQQRQQILETWRSLFPGDEWAANLE
jgi:hypothetical protein